MIETILSYLAALIVFVIAGIVGTRVMKIRYGPKKNWKNYKNPN